MSPGLVHPSTGRGSLGNSRYTACCFMPCAPLRVLVVDDDHDCATSQAAVLRTWGFRAEVAFSGVDALQAAERNGQPDVVILDLAMPHPDGFEVARRIKQTFSKPPLLIAVSGYGRHEDVRESLAAGFDCHFLKPADLDGLKELL